MRFTAQLAVLLLTLAWGAVLGQRHALRTARPRPSAVAAGSPAAAARSRAQAYFILSAAECDGALDVLALFDRPPIASRVSLRTLYLLGDDAERDRVQDALRSRGLHATARRAPPAIAMQRNALGYNGPVLVITDARDRIMAARQAPTSPEEFAQLAGYLETLPRPTP